MTAVLVSIGGLLALVALSLGTAVFVAAEFSLTSLERSQIDAELARRPDRRSRHVQHAHRTLSFQLSGAQVGITITTLITGYLAEPAVARILDPALSAIGLPVSVAGPVSIGLALVLANSVSMVIGELAPKNLAIARPIPTARAVAGLQIGFSAVFRWLIRILNGTANMILRRIGIEPAEELRSVRSPRELGALVRSSAAHGTLDSNTATLLDRSLRFVNRTAGDLMTPRVRVVALTPDASVAELIDTAQRTGVSRYPVYRGDLDDVIGVVHVKQAFAVPAEQRAATAVETLARPVPVVPESLDGDILLDRLRESGLQIALVADEYGGTAGLVTLEDVVEEIIGDVRDEHDRREAPSVTQLDARTWLASGLLREDESAEQIGFRPPPGEYETLAGLMLEHLGRIPAVGDEILVEGWTLTVTRMDRRRVAELRVHRTAQSDDEDAESREAAADVHPASHGAGA